MTARGFIMLEVLIALLILGVLVSGVADLALGGYARTAEARRAALAASLAADLAGRTRALPDVDWSALPEPLDCVPDCPPEAMAALELADWQALAAATLAEGAGLLAKDAGGALVLTLSWRETGGSLREFRLGIAR
jgi:Tfp pilus assembly protein PilV